MDRRLQWAEVINALIGVFICLLVLQISTSFLPNIVIFQYLNTTRLLLFTGFILLIPLYLLDYRPPATGAQSKLFRILCSLILLMFIWQTMASLVSPTALSLPVLRLRMEEFMAFLLVVYYVRDKNNLRNLQTVFLVALWVVALISIRQFTNHANTGHFLVNDGGWKVAESLVVPKDSIVRVVGCFHNPNVLASFFLLLLPSAILNIRRNDSTNWILAVLVVLSGVALLLTFSRSAVLALLLAFGVVFVRKKTVLLAPIVLLVAAVLTNPFSTGRFATGFTRLDAWSAALFMISLHPLFGIGPGNFREFASNDLHTYFWHAHNTCLTTAAESGIVAGALLLGVFVMMIICAIDLSRQGGSGGHLGTAFTISFIAFFIVSLVDDAYNATPVSYTFWLLSGLLIAARNIYSKDQAS